MTIVIIIATQPFTVTVIFLSPGLYNLGEFTEHANAGVSMQASLTYTVLL